MRGEIPKTHTHTHTRKYLKSNGSYVIVHLSPLFVVSRNEWVVVMTHCWLLNRLNGLIQRLEMALKDVSLRLCNEKPREWHHYLIPTLFYPQGNA